ncbi:MAG: flavodoxin-dependent (E)-4-hydroxy-3-methylbut-2-enyl-diphosphate synthase [Actinobacteria bacterium]|nr:flavodoxin-dependent (E)-4-hydroxy-3-methylbut-2-enyl-diphosphate synthase [Actinomycetota bacterium]
MRRTSKQIKIGNLKIGGNEPILVQSMTNTKTSDVSATVNQIKELEKAGCEIVRVAVLDKKSAEVLGEIKRRINIPLVADIHFDYRLALIALENGIDKLRINPGNIGSYERVKAIVEKTKEKEVPIRIGVNSGSVADKYMNRSKNLVKALVDSALDSIEILESLGFYDIVLSVKASSVPVTIEAYQLLAKQVDYPLHIGITEAGTILSGTVKSAVGLGVLLYEGVGDTIRVSLTANPVEEVKVGYKILNSLDLRKRGVDIISCPTCGRCEIDLIEMVNEIEKRLESCAYPLKIAVMGCVVNGPGEAKEADIGVAGGKKEGLIFAKGKTLRKVAQEDIVDVLMAEIENRKIEI